MCPDLQPDGWHTGPHLRVTPVPTERVTEAGTAAHQLRDALTAVGITLPVGATPPVWGSPAGGPVRLVEVGPMLPDVAARIAEALRAPSPAGCADE